MTINADSGLDNMLVGLFSAYKRDYLAGDADGMANAMVGIGQRLEEHYAAAGIIESRGCVFLQDSMKATVKALNDQHLKPVHEELASRSGANLEAVFAHLEAYSARVGDLRVEQPGEYARACAAVIGYMFEHPQARIPGQ